MSKLELTKNSHVSSQKRVFSNNKKINQFLKECVRYKGLLIMLIPAVVWYLIFKYYTMYGVVIAFKDYKILGGITGSPWVGFKYFTRLFSSAQFGEIFRNTVVISGYKLLITFPAPILLAILLNEIKHTRFKKTIQSITYLPHFISWVVISGLIANILSPVDGVVNYILGLVGLGPYKFLMMPSAFRSIVVIAAVWKGVGWGSIVYLAAITGVDQSLYEAAEIDGATRFRQMMHITIPSIIPVIVIMFIMRIGNIMEAGFEEIINLYNPTVYSVGDILDTYAYRVGLIDFNYSYSTAISFFQNIVGLILLFITNAFSKRISEHGLW